MAWVGTISGGGRRWCNAGRFHRGWAACWVLSQDEPFGEGVHLFTETVGELMIGACAEFTVEDNCLDNHCHVGEVEVAFGAFPQADEDVVGVVAVAEGCADAVPVERYFFWVTVEYECYIVTEVEVEIVDSTLGKG